MDINIIYNVEEEIVNDENFEVGLKYMVLHPGAHVGNNFKYCKN